MIRWLHVVVISVWLLLFATAVNAQNFPMIHYTVDDGLPSNVVNHIYRDSKGFLWIATDKGIARFNGIKFETFTTDDGMPDNEIFFFQEDKQGRLWLATYSGELCYYKDGRFHNADNTPFLRLPFKNTNINKIVVEKDSSVTIMFDKRQKFINIKGDNIDIINIDLTKNIAGFFFAAKLSPDIYKFYYADSIKTVDKSQKIVSRQAANYPYYSKACGDMALAIAQDQKYIFSKCCVYTIDMAPLKLLDDNTSVKTITGTVFYDKDHKFLKSTDRGLFIDDTTHILNDYKITSLTQDIEDNYWIATFDGGIFVLDYKYRHSRLYENAYLGNIRYAYADNDNLFFTTSENNLYHLKDNINQCVFNYGLIKANRTEYAVNHGYLITKDSATNTYDYLNFYKNFIIDIKDVVTGRKTHIHDHPFIEGESVKSIIDLRDNIYVRTISKIYSRSTSDFADDLLYKSRLPKEVGNTDRIFAYAKSEGNELFFSTVNGVFKIWKDTTEIQKQFQDNTFKKFEFIGNYLVGYTHNNRLLICHNINDRITIDTIPKQNCIWDRFFKVDSTHMLISTNDVYRLFTINPSGSKAPWTVNAVENPIVPRRAEWFCNDDENCYFFVNGTIIKMRINNLLQRSKPPQLFFDLLVYGGHRFVMYDELSVPYQRAKSISISFSTLSFTGKEIAYRYSISKNGEDNWQELTSNHIDLIDPSYGQYTIKIKAKGISSAYSTPIEYTLNILPPYWARWWFITLCVIAGIAVVVVAVRYRILFIVRKNEKENENKIRFLKSEYKALNALMNPHFIFNTLNNVQGLVNRNDKLAANEYLRIFADLIRQNMHNVSKELISLQKEIELVTNYLALEKLRFKEMLNYSINVDEQVDATEIMVPPLFIQPLVENSIKHGIFPRQSENSRIELNVYEKGDLLYIEVRDNGVGLSAAKKKADSKHESFGLNNIKVRIEQLSIILGKTIDFRIEEIVDERDSWTVVTITMSL